MSNRIIRMALLASIVLMLAAAVFWLWRTGSTTEASSPMASSSAPTDFFVCTPDVIGAFSDRVHVHCNPAAPGAIAYFAVCTASDSVTASRYLSMFTTAYATGKHLGIYYTAANTSGTACGCAAGDCRLADGVDIRP